MTRIKVYIMTHKIYEFCGKPDIYIPLLVGAQQNKLDCNYLRDDDGYDNISEKNENYCELTGLYWVWKHSEADIVGINHYRRYFTRNNHFRKKEGVLTGQDIERILCEYDIILPKRGKEHEYSDRKAREFFAEVHEDRIWLLFRSIVINQDSSYRKDFEWFENETTGYCYNMMITRKQLFDEYMEFVFGVLNKLESMVDYNSYSNYNKRMPGFVSERLINLWVHHNEKLKVYECPIYFTEDLTRPEKLQMAVGKRINKLKQNFGNMSSAGKRKNGF